MINNQSILKNDDVSNSVRTRYAPSPTGPNHIGGVRTALYKYLFAKKHGGKFILRIEDTDSKRFVPGAEEYIIESFKWLGLDFDEGPNVGGSYGPYKQSERKNIYKDYALMLINKGLAYYAFDSSDDLDQARKIDSHFSYDYNSRKSLKNSLTLSQEEVKHLTETSNNWTIRIKYPDQPTTIVVNDIIRGVVKVESDTLDDKVIWKCIDQLPTYHLANIVDDHLMKISHVIRGEEWLPSAPLHVYLYECFDWVPPLFAHLPLILKPEGNGKLSKRDGDLLGFPVFPLEWIDPSGDESKNSKGYRGEGYLPKAVLNFLVFLGWNPGTEKEVYSLDELIQDFSLERVNKGGARFNPTKANWFNAQYLKKTDTELLVDYFKSDLEKRGIYKDDDFIFKVVDKYKGKVDFIKNLYDEVKFIFDKPIDFDKKSLKKWKYNSDKIVKDFVNKLSNLNDWFANDIQNIFNNYTINNNINTNELASVLRLLLTGKASGTSPFDTMEIIGKIDTLDRLTKHNLSTDTNISNLDNNVDNIKKQKINQLSAELDGSKKSLKSTEGKLSNVNFMEKAPKDVVDNEIIKKDELILKISKIEKELFELQA